MIDFEEKIRQIDAEQQKLAQEIVRTIELLLEEAFFLKYSFSQFEFDERVEQDCYTIATQQTPYGNYLSIINVEGTLKIETVGGVFIEAEGITLEDVEYWSNLYSV